MTASLGCSPVGLQQTWSVHWRLSRPLAGWLIHTLGWCWLVPLSICSQVCAVPTTKGRGLWSTFRRWYCLNLPHFSSYPSFFPVHTNFSLVMAYHFFSSGSNVCFASFLLRWPHSYVISLQKRNYDVLSHCYSYKLGFVNYYFSLLKMWALGKGHCWDCNGNETIGWEILSCKKKCLFVVKPQRTRHWL